MKTKKIKGSLLRGPCFFIILIFILIVNTSNTGSQVSNGPDSLSEREIVNFMKNKSEGNVYTEIIPVKEAEKLKWETYAGYPEYSLNYSPRSNMLAYDKNSEYSIGFKMTLLTENDIKYQKLEASTAQILNDLKDESDETKVEKTKAWIKANCKYTDKVMNMWDECLYGCLVYGKATCLGYAQGFYYMMKKLHVPCEIEFNSYHAWNKVLVDGEWITVDLTK